jgi:hypothetical protein
MKARLILLAHGRSGDKGNSVNVGIIARRESWYEFLRSHLTAERVSKHLKALAGGPVERYELPNLGAINFLVHGALDGGGSLSLRLDAQGKTYAQAVLYMAVDLPEALAREVREHWGADLPADCVVTS